MSMISVLNDLFEISKVGKDWPFPPSLLIYNEGWLLRAVLQLWASSRENKGLPFSCPKEASLFSEAQLRTPFYKAPLKETNTRVNGLVGDFTIRDGTKSGIDIKQDFKFLAVFEAKMYSGFAQGTTKIKNYSQVSRTIACMINELVLKKPLAGSCSIYYIGLYPKDSKKIRQPEQKYTKDNIKKEITLRLENDETSHFILKQFNTEWERFLNLIKIEFKTWEEIIDQINQVELKTFYDKCMECGGKEKEIE